MAARRASFLVLLAVMAGCTSSRHFPEDSSDAEHAIERAEDAGAGEHSKMALVQARDTLERARRAEDDATHDKQAAREQLHAAKRRAERAEQRLELRRRRRGEFQDEKRVQEMAIERVKERQSDLRAKGLSDEEVTRLTDMEQSFARIRLRGIDAELATVEKELELLELEKKDAHLDVDAASARLATADQRLVVSRALFQRAQEQARLAEAESLDARRAGFRARVNTM